MNTSEKQRVDAIIRNLKKKRSDWKWFMGPQGFTADQLIVKIQRDRSFRRTVLMLVDDYVVDKLFV